MESHAGVGVGCFRSQQVHPPECCGSTDWALLASSPTGGVPVLAVFEGRRCHEDRVKRQDPHFKSPWCMELALDTSDLTSVHPVPTCARLLRVGLSSRRPGGLSGVSVSPLVEA